MCVCVCVCVLVANKAAKQHRLPAPWTPTGALAQSLELVGLVALDS